MRLIDADQCVVYFYEHMTDDDMAVALNAIEEMPTADAVPVVRCKDCVYYKGDCYCRYFECGTQNNGYCHHGEREE